MLFRATAELDLAGLRVQVPVFSSIDWAAAVIALAAAIAMLRFKIGALPVLACGALAGLATLLL